MIFNKESIHYKDMLQEMDAEKKTPALEAAVPEIKELLDYMEQDVLFRHEVLVFFYKYRNNKPEPKGQETASGVDKK